MPSPRLASNRAVNLLISTPKTTGSSFCASRLRSTTHHVTSSSPPSPKAVSPCPEVRLARFPTIARSLSHLRYRCKSRRRLRFTTKTAASPWVYGCKTFRTIRRMSSRSCRSSTCLRTSHRTISSNGSPNSAPTTIVSSRTRADTISSSRDGHRGSSIIAARRRQA